MFIFNQYAKIRDDEKQTHIGTQQDLNLVFSLLKCFMFLQSICTDSVSRFCFLNVKEIIITDKVIWLVA